MFLPLEGADWPQFLGPNRDNTSPETGLINGWTESGPKRLWAREIGIGYAAPAVRDGMLVAHCRIGSEEVVEAMEATTGKTLWTYKYPSQFIDPFGFNNGPRCSPLLTADRVYTYGAEGRLVCVNRKDGKLIWERKTQEEWEIPEAFFGVGSSPVLEDGKLFVMVGGQPNSGMVAFDAETGKTVWENVGEKTWTGVKMTGWPGERVVRWNRSDPTYEKLASYCSPVLATIHGKRHLLCVMRQGLVSLDPATGAHRFSFWFRARQNESVNAMTPVVSGNTILLSAPYYGVGSVLLRVLPEGTGVEPVWKTDELEMHWAHPVLAGGVLLAFSGRNEPDAALKCVDFATGKVNWVRDEAFGRGRSGGQPPVFGRASGIFVDGKHIVLGEAGLLGLFLPEGDRVKEVARFQVPELSQPTWAGPVLSDGRLYLRGEERLICFDLKKDRLP